MAKRKLTFCACGARAHTAGMKTLLDGTKKRRYQCRQCSDRWMVVVGRPKPPEEEQTVRRNGLWMHWRGYWYSYEEQARIRESVQMR